MEMKVRNVFDKPLKVVVDCSKDKKLTKQADKAACDINNILSRYEKTGRLPELQAREPRYGDFSSVPSYMEACEIVSRAQEQFEALGAHVRDRFANDPSKMLEFMSDNKNMDEAIKLGLVVKKALSPSQPNGKDGVVNPSDKPASGEASGSPAQ